MPVGKESRLVLAASIKPSMSKMGESQPIAVRRSRTELLGQMLGRTAPHGCPHLNIALSNQGDWRPRCFSACLACS